MNALRLWSACALVLVGTTPLAAQMARVRVIPADSLETAAREILGDSTAWPVLIQASRRNESDNSFFLDGKAASLILTFGKSHREAQRSHELLRGEIQRGAQVFAPVELRSAETALGRYRSAVAEGNPSQADLHRPVFLAAVRTLREAVESRRTEEIMAALSSKDGSVDRRSGLLGAWKEAELNDQLAPSDAVKTGDRSRAGLSFSDGVDVYVSERTTIVIRESHRDILQQRTRRDVDLVRGDVLARLSEAARDGGDMTVQAGPARSTVRSGRFWVQAEDRREMRLSNYDGSVDLTSNNVQVRLEKNQGTIARQGQAPMKPVALLPPPQLSWASTDTITGSADLLLAWRPVNGAVSYVVETSDRRAFDDNVVQQRVNRPRLQLSRLAPGITYVRISAVDRLGLRGIESSAYSIVRTEDRVAPALMLEFGDSDSRVTARERAILRGRTEPGATLTVNGSPVGTAPDGSFEAAIVMSSPSVRVRLSAVDAAGNEATRSLTLTRVESDRLSRVVWSVPEQNGNINSGGGPLAFNGSAYPDMRVRWIHGSEVHSALTGPDGTWSIVLDSSPRGSCTLTMELLAESTTVFSKTYELR